MCGNAQVVCKCVFYCGACSYAVSVWVQPSVVEQQVCVRGLICGQIGGLLGCLTRDCGVIQLCCDLFVARCKMKT